MTCVYLLPQAKFEFKDSSIQDQKLPDMLPLSPCICQYMRRFFVKRPMFFAATSNLRVEQNLVYLGRFLHYSQKVVGVTLTKNLSSTFCLVSIVAVYKGSAYCE